MFSATQFAAPFHLCSCLQLRILVFVLFNGTQLSSVLVFIVFCDHGIRDLPLLQVHCCCFLCLPQIRQLLCVIPTRRRHNESFHVKRETLKSVHFWSVLDSVKFIYLLALWQNTGNLQRMCKGAPARRKSRWRKTVNSHGDEVTASQVEMDGARGSDVHFVRTSRSIYARPSWRNGIHHHVVMLCASQCWSMDLLISCVCSAGRSCIFVIEAITFLHWLYTSSCKMSIEQHRSLF